MLDRFSMGEVMTQIYLVPGFFGFTELGSFNYFHRVSETLEESLVRRGLTAEIIEVDTIPTGSIRRRAKRLLEFVVSHGGLEADRVHFVGHSIRSFGVRAPLCTKEHPSYGIIGLFHILPPALAWLWRLVSPRGHNNPSIIQTQGMKSEGVGSYWPFVPGRRVDQANLLLRQILETPKMRYVLCPNQNIGAWNVGFMPNWIMREYLSRRGLARFSSKQVVPARSPLLGYALRSMMVEGQTIGSWLLQVDKQPEVGEDAYDVGAGILSDFFHAHLPQFLEPDILPLGKKIIECCMSSGSVEDYCSFIAGESVIEES